VHFQIFLEEWLEGVVEACLDFDEESFVFIAGFAVVSLSGDSATNPNQTQPHKKFFGGRKSSASDPTIEERRQTSETERVSGCRRCEHA